MLEIRLLGQYDVRRDGELLEITSRPSRLLLAYLALTAGKRHPRERLAGLLWPESDEANARSNLRQALWRLRKAIGEAYLLVDKETVALNTAAGCWLDTALLEDGSDQALTAAAAAYEGELLPGYYEEWVLLERERLRALFERQMQRLLDTLEQQEEWPELVRWAEQWIAFGEVPERAYRALMIAHAGQGDLAAAAAAYERCAKALQLEVGVEPSTETRALYDRLLIGTELPIRTPRTAADSAAKARPRHNLPHQSTPFIGRDYELDQVKKLLADARLLTLVGPGGTGKTRLAQQAAFEQVGSFKNGVYFVSLAPIDSPGLIVQTIAESIGFPLSSHEDPQRQLLRHLRHRHYLLLLDNFEHLLSGAPLVSEILHSAAQVKIMATSREKLNLQEETLVRIEGLAYPPTSSATNALDFSAIKLFVESARQARSDFAAGADDMPHIIHICRLLEGMPLGILLAAAWVEQLTLQEIAAEITRSLDFLRAEWRGVPERHLSVRAVFDSSWQRLTEEQRELFASLAVFKGGFTRDAAEIVTGASLQDLASLVNKSLLRRDLETGRYEMHELLRQYAREHLRTMPDTRNAVARAHAACFADLMQQLWLKLISSEQQMALATIDAELENIRQAWRYWLEKRHARRIRMFLHSFWRVFEVRGWNKTGMEFYKNAVAVLKPALETADEEMEIAYAEVARGQAQFMAHLGYADGGLLLAQESVSILRRLGRYQELGLPLVTLQYNTIYIENPQKVFDIKLSEAKYANNVEGQWKQAFVTTWMGRKIGLSGNYKQAKELLEGTRELFEGVGDRLSTAWTWLELGHLAVMVGDYDEARENLERVQVIAQEFEFGWAMAKATRYLGNIATILGEFQGARKDLLSSLRLADELGMIRDVISAVYDIATVEAAAGDKETAVRLLTVVKNHPLSHHTRTFSLFSGDTEVRFQKLAIMHLARLQEEMPPDAYSAALSSGSRALDLETAVLELLANPTPSML